MNKVVRPIRVAIIHASDQGGGAERSVVSVHRSLREAGHLSDLYVGQKYTEEAHCYQIPYHRGPPGMRRLARWYEQATGAQDIYNPSFLKFCRAIRGKYDVVHFNSLWGSSGFADLNGLPVLTNGTPSVITLRDEWLLTGHCACTHDCVRWKIGCGDCPDLRRAPAIQHDGTAKNFRRKKKVFEKSPIHVVAISDYLLNKVRSSPILGAKTSSRIYNGLNLDIFAPVTPAHRQKRRGELGVQAEDKLVLLAGQTVEGIREGIATHHAIAALKAAHDQGHTIRALIVGRSAQRVAQQCGVPAISLDFQDDPASMAELYGISDITIVASEVEAFGRIGAESQACGTPVAGFDTGGVPEVVRHGIGGLLVPRKNTSALCAALIELVSDARRRAALAEGGRKYAIEQFDQRLITKEYLGLFERLVSGDSRRAP